MMMATLAFRTRNKRREIYYAAAAAIPQEPKYDELPQKDRANWFATLASLCDNRIDGNATDLGSR